jgi:hypothetical protein
LKTLRVIFSINLHVDKSFKHRGGGIHGAVDDGAAFCVPPAGDVESACAIEICVVADAPEVHDSASQAVIP